MDRARDGNGTEGEIREGDGNGEEDKGNGT